MSGSVAPVPLSPFYSPEIFGSSPRSLFGPPPAWWPAWLPFSPALLILPIPALFRFVGPRHLVYAAALEMHPLDAEDRARDLKHTHGIGFCNITKCCTNVCPESITITDNAIIPLKERVIDRLYDPVAKLVRVLRG